VPAPRRRKRRQRRSHHLEQAGGAEQLEGARHVPGDGQSRQLLGHPLLRDLLDHRQRAPDGGPGGRVEPEAELAGEADGSQWAQAVLGEPLARMTKVGLLADDGNRVRLTREGLFVSDAIWPHFLRR
jgi:hypothetical protein